MSTTAGSVDPVPTPSRTAGSSSTPGPDGLFTRKSSGLVRDIGVGGALGMGVGFLNVGFALGYFALVLTLFPGVNALWALLIGGVLTSTLAFVYTQLAASMPRDGGDFIYHARIFHPVVGAWFGVAWLIDLLYTLGTVADFSVSAFVAPSLQAIGTSLHIQFLVTLAGNLATRSGTLICGLVILLLCIAAVVAGARTAGRVAYWTAIIGLLGTVVVIVELLVHGSSFQHGFNTAASNPHAYQGVLAAARHAGWHPGFSGSATLNAIPYAFLAFGGFWLSVYAGGEVKQPLRTQRLASFLAIGVALILVIGAWLAMQAHGRGDFIQASAYLQDHGSTSALGLTPVAYAEIVGSGLTKTLVAIGFLAWVIPGTIGAILASSRILFALSFDRLLPTAVASVTGRRRTPMVALAITAVIIVGFFILVVYDQGVTGAFRNVVTINAFVALAAAIAAAALPYRRTDIYNASPRVLPGKLFGLERITWMSLLAAAFCAVVMYLTLTQTQYGNGLTTTSVITLIVTFVVGPVIYWLARVMRRDDGINMDLAMRELPPE